MPTEWAVRLFITFAMDMHKKDKMEINIQVILLLLLVGLLAGMMSGFVGIGGGVVMVPAMVYLLGFSQLQAQGTSLAVLVMPVGILAVMNYYKAGQMEVSAALVIAIGFVVGGFFGSKYALKLPEHKVKFVFALLMLYVVGKMLYTSGMKWWAEVH
jgi:uncharacterized membrane protein YfcA